MNMPLVLLYNLDKTKAAKIQRMCLPLKIRVRQVSPECYTLPLGSLVDGDGTAAPDEAAGFTDEMLLLVQFTGPLLEQFLQGFRRNKIPPVPLKAVLTPTNREWTSLQLHQELLRERQAIQQGQAAHTASEAPKSTDG